MTEFQYVPDRRLQPKIPQPIHHGSSDESPMTDRVKRLKKEGGDPATAPGGTPLCGSGNKEEEPHRVPLKPPGSAEH